MRLNDGEGFTGGKAVVKSTKSSDMAGERTGLVSGDTKMSAGAWRHRNQLATIEVVIAVVAANDICTYIKNFK